jgi:hypothetical protein
MRKARFPLELPDTRPSERNLAHANETATWIEAIQKKFKENQKAKAKRIPSTESRIQYCKEASKHHSQRFDFQRFSIAWQYQVASVRTGYA